MQIELTPEQVSFIDMGIQSGRFRNADDAMRKMLVEWEQRERARMELLASLELAQHSVEAGEGETYTADTMHLLVDSVKKRGMENLAGK